MDTIIHHLGFRALTEDKAELLDLIDSEIDRAQNQGDLLGVGEWLASKLEFVEDEEIEPVFTSMVACWASPVEFKSAPSTISDLVSKYNEFVADHLAVALASATLRFLQLRRHVPKSTGDLAFRLADAILRTFETSARNPFELTIACARKLEAALGGLNLSVESLLNTNCVTAKIASIEVVRKAHQLRAIALPAEQAILSEVEILLGPAFRRFCEACEREDTKEVIKRAPDIKELAQKFAPSAGVKANSTLWHFTVSRVSRHILHLVEEGSAKSKAASIPSLGLATKVFKMDLSKPDRELVFSSRLLNTGEGRAIDVNLQAHDRSCPVELRIIEPAKLFEVSGESEQVISLRLKLAEKSSSIKIPITWCCSTVNRHLHIDEDYIEIEQQHVQPRWDDLVENPPYSLNPVKDRTRLFGRDTILQELLLHAAGGTSTFIWGQKRVGKTSVIQVLTAELEKRKNFVCVVMRMGELGPLHEGQIAHRIASRIAASIPESTPEVPKEELFGAGMSKLVPHVENILSSQPGMKIVVVIDEFDDLDPAFYTGQRGKLFVKALRSLSEIGMTFFFVGSERMNSIYVRHQVDLNKWMNVSLNCIESREDCKNLVVQPVIRAIEYQPECVPAIVDYCGGNPFYMNLLCSEIFKRCWQEQRTYVDENDLGNVRRALVRIIGAANFSHFWEDNPELDELKKAKQAAENCLILSCISRLPGGFESCDELVMIQDGMHLGPSERLSPREIRSATELLNSRGVVSADKRDRRFKIRLPIFSDWLIEQADLQLLPRWKEFCLQPLTDSDLSSSARSIPFVDSHFPIPEEELLSVSQSLVYCGKQKDASEIRVWLRQFDDDNRIETAFTLLKRLAQKGYVTEGAKLQALSKVEDAVYAARLKIGKRQWIPIRGRNDNLCIGYLDTEMKSGGATARELANRLRPGKRDHADSLLDWMKSHVDKDPIVVLVDDFAGTGGSFSKGISKFLETVARDRSLQKYLVERRILCYLLFAFPEALKKLKTSHPQANFMAINVFSEDVRALDSDAEIFSSEHEVNFAKDVLTQIGRELWNEYPLGYGDLEALVCFHSTCPNNTLPIFWSNGTVNGRPWKPLFPRA